jgi:hypothetical protein
MEQHSPNDESDTGSLHVHAMLETCFDSNVITDATAREMKMSYMREEV